MLGYTSNKLDEITQNEWYDKENGASQIWSVNQAEL